MTAAGRIRGSSPQTANITTGMVAYQGKQSKDGKYYDRNGAYDGKKSKDGKYYDRYGAYQGKAQ